MKFLFLKIRVIWRRFRHGLQARYEHHADHAPQLEVLMRRADPDSAWHDRANWMIDVAEWIRHQPKVSLLDAEGWRRVKHQRVRAMLDWLDAHRDIRRQVQNCLQKTLREASGPELFSVTGLPHESAFFSELTERAFKILLPRHLSPSELPTLFAAMFPDPDDAEWLLELDQELQERLWKLAADDGISHTYWQQIEEALTYLTTVVVADGISPAFRQRLEPKMPLQATPFMALRREMEAYLRAAPYDEGALRSARMLIAVCQAQTDRIYAHLDEYGVSVSLVYRLERMRAQLGRMGRLIDVRSSTWKAQPATPETGRVQLLLADLVAAHHSRSSVRSLVRRSFALLARKMVERSADHGEHYIARDRASYYAMLKAACFGGIVTAFTVLMKIALGKLGLADFFEGAFASLNYAISFLIIAAIGGVLATKQPAVTAPALAAKMGELDTVDGLRALLGETAMLLRSQAAAIFGNIAAVIPTMLLITAAFMLMFGATLMTPDKARAAMHDLSLVGPAPLYAAFTGVLLWLSSLAAGFADNWFALRRLREALAHQRRLVHALGATRAARWAAWLERHVATIAGNVSLGVLLGMTPVLAHFFGLPLDVRHVTLATGTLVAAGASLGWGIVATPAFWLAVCGVLLIGALNVGVAFSCALALALRARDIPARIRRVVFRAVLRRFTASPWTFFFPEKAVSASVKPVPTESETEEER
ncbi:site-specific recombinase [Herbaspirillum sp. RV1423]|uniref:site-specific recombinase n=1 Tax=Herbaspirillum sp. RV1423 TaxID=1443993 RepID=UPI0004BC26B3|nr:site-specific recombinase [Herbaspirillum sp. RV1423]